MKIAIDVRPTVGQFAGIGKYTYNLVREIAKLDRENEYLLYSFFLKPFSSNIKEIAKSHPNFSLKASRIPGRLMRFFWDYLKIPIEPFLGKVDVLHVTDYLMPQVRKAKLVVTIHDVTPLSLPQYHNRYTRTYIRNKLLSIAERADRIIAVSENTKRDIMSSLSIPESKIKVIYEAIDESYHPIEDIKFLDRIRKRYTLPDKFILHVGTIEPRKNITRLIKAFATLKKMKSLKHKLVIAGQKGWRYDDIFREVKDLDLESEVIFIGYVSEEDLPGLYNAAQVFVYPSLYEGFGLAPLEAMACGTPVICSNTSSLPEVVGDAANVVDPYNTDEMARAIGEVLTDGKLRQEMGAKGLKRASLFSWKKAARETLSVYRDLYNQ
ncbi:glycosyltransferase family 4 protein [bacterium]|nr:glycosyltransferase family 4 protein [bacterium]